MIGYEPQVIADIIQRAIPIIHQLRVDKIRALEIAGLNENIRAHTLQMCALSINNFADDLINLLKEATDINDNP